MKNKKTIGLIIGFVIVALIAFYAGMSLGKNNTQANKGNQAFGQNFNGGNRGGMRGGGFVSGQIVSKDANSITVELRTPMGQNVSSDTANQGQGSKIVFYTDKTNIMKTTDGTIDDLSVGKNISITGTANPDGSLNAQSIQIRPAVPMAPTQQ